MPPLVLYISFGFSAKWLVFLYLRPQIESSAMVSSQRAQLSLLPLQRAFPSRKFGWKNPPPGASNQRSPRGREERAQNERGNQVRFQKKWFDLNEEDENQKRKWLAFPPPPPDSASAPPMAAAPLLLFMRLWPNFKPCRENARSATAMVCLSS